ncbi:methylmalonyl-CoA mutase family protein [Aurantimonas sp. MSK8Z-1]|uniref:methylmalonyl-CoA mutase family protein n=1 Tax=Mangrovibrevibacter kandeliae TaxID=2968473 RepID=UPI002117963D|nr:methylmalonyl-CoA mutase family protein [Aurantimonas sp. MSK8Z-1]MCW4113635.1 methylmalonyl-CoA mutase family protein [Aurantimonas sp. MSK8Z-1]
MTDSSEDVPLVSEADWRALVERQLHGAPFETLETLAEDGFRYGPIHARRGAEPILREGAGRPWSVVQRVDDPDLGRATRQADDDVKGGATGVAFCFAGSPAARGFGVPLDADALAPLILHDAGDRDVARIRLEPHAEFAALATFAGRLTQLGRRGVDVGLDPVGPLAGVGPRPHDAADLAARFADAVRQAHEAGVVGRLVEADGRVFHDAGATPAQELAAVLAVAVQALRTLDGAGITVGEAADRLGLTVALDQRAFIGIAKLRALRLLWARLMELLAGPAAPARVHAETSFRMTTVHDAETGILRNTVAAFAAGVGGADSLTVLPHTIAAGLPEAKARRLARNLQLLLIEESGLHHLADPAAGAGGLEVLTDRLCEAAWAELQRIEAEGGILRSLGTGGLQTRIAAAAGDREAKIAAGEEVIVGINRYRAPSEAPAQVLTIRGDTEQAATPVPGALTPRRLEARAGSAA